MGTETKVVVTTVNVNIYGGLEYYGSGVKIYPFKGNMALISMLRTLNFLIWKEKKMKNTSKTKIQTHYVG